MSGRFSIIKLTNYGRQTSALTNTNFMKHLFPLFLLVFFLSGCKLKQTDNTASPNKLPVVEQAVLQSNMDDTLGPVVSTIEFKLKAKKEDLKIFEDGFIPWVSLDHPEKDISSLINPDETVLPYSTVTLLIDYPLNIPATFELSTSEKGFSRKQLILEISKRYHEVYKEEEASATEKTTPLDKRKGLINRNETNGKYGVWGHDLSDLDLSSIEVHKNAAGKITLILDVES